VTATLSGMTITGGTGDNGGGLLNQGTADLIDVTINGNSAVFGGGVMKYHGSANLTNVTISGNSAEFGGGLFTENATAELTDVTVSGNSGSNEGGGMYNSGGSHITLIDTIVAGNANGDVRNFAKTYGGIAVTGNYNLIGDGTGQSGLGFKLP
jgi:hypothetical protein